MLRDNEVHVRCRPFAVAIKALLAKHLPPLLKVLTPPRQVGPTPNPGPKAGRVLDVIVQHPVPGTHDGIIERIMNNREKLRRTHSRDVDGIEAAMKLHSKMDTLRSLLSRHPDPWRIPMVTSDSTTKPKPEDQEINDLLLEARTLGQVYDRDFILLMEEKPLS